jgi:hypothetical protein
VLCVKPDAVTPDGLGVEYREVLALARDDDEARRLAKGFLGQDYVPVTAMVHDTLSDHAGLLLDHGLTDEAPVKESAI